MTDLNTARLRLINQGLASQKFSHPAEVVRSLVAVQAQEYAGAKWSLGARSPNATDDDVEEAFARGDILRTHVLRPTWHFVAPDDIRWLLTLTAPRVNAANAYYYRRLELDDAVFRRSNAALAKALRGGRQLIREELQNVLQKVGIAADGGPRLSYLLMRAELEGIICSGARRGKHFTYALLDERVPVGKRLDRDEALAELADRYFATRGPASAQDFAKWSGLTLTDSRRGLDAVKATLTHQIIAGRTYWLPKDKPVTTANSRSTAHLLPIYDEYVSSYQHYGAIVDGEAAAKLTALGNMLQNIIIIGGRVAGTWSRKINRQTVTVVLNFLTTPTKSAGRAVQVAAGRYGDFLTRTIEIV